MNIPVAWRLPCLVSTRLCGAFAEPTFGSEASPFLPCPLPPPGREAPTAYRPRCPESTAFYRLVMDHFDRFAVKHRAVVDT